MTRFHKKRLFSENQYFLSHVFLIHLFCPELSKIKKIEKQLKKYY
jgi:hypothetical protein